MSERYSKEQIREIKKPDAFVAWGRVRMEWLAGHTQLALILLGVVLVGSFSWYGYAMYQNSFAEKAWEAFYIASQKEEKDRWSALEQMHNAHASTRAGFFAAVTVADHYFQQAKAEVQKQMTPPAAETKGKAKEVSFNYKLTSVPTEKENAQKASEWYTKALGFSGLSSDERGLVEINLGGAYEVAGDFAQAEKRYENAARTDLSKGPAQLALGRISEMQGNREKAIQVYTKMEQDFTGKDKNPEYLKMAQGALRRIQGGLFAN